MVPDDHGIPRRGKLDPGATSTGQHSGLRDFFNTEEVSGFLQTMVRNFAFYLFTFICMGVFPACTSDCSGHKSQKRALDPLKLKFHMTMSQHVRVRNLESFEEQRML